MKYKYRDACFACTTPYQVMGAVSIVKNEGLKADIYIFETFPDHIAFAARLEKLGIFENVYVDKSGRSNFFGKGKTGLAIKALLLYQLLFPKRALSGFLDKRAAYKTFYSSSRAHGKLLLQRVLQKRNPEMNIVIYDDGLGSYLENSHVLRSDKSRQRLEKLLGWNLFDPKLVSIELYLPKIAHIPQELSECSLTEMPRLDWQEPDNKRILKEVFGVTENESYSEKVILFDNVRGLKARVEMFEKVDECYRTILDVVGKDDVLFKAHPRSVEKPDLDFHCAENQAAAMEVYYADMDDLDSRILIAYNSTAAYTPKLLFDKEPWVINLHRIVGPPMQENSEALYQTFLPTYENREKMLAPETLEELKQMLLIALGRNSQ